MYRLRQFCAWLLCWALLCAPVSDANARVYRVKKGDWLGKIGRRFLRGDPWSKNGSVHRIVRVNPDIHNPDIIYPNELLIIPDDTLVKRPPRHRRSVRRPIACKPAPPAPCHCPTPVACSCPAPPVCKTHATAIMQNLPESLEDNTAQLHLEQERDVIRIARPPLRHHLRLRVSPYYRFTQLEAQSTETGAALTLASRYNIGVALELSVNLLENLHLVLNVRGGNIYFASPSANAALLRSAFFSYGASFGAEVTPFKRLAFFAGGGYGNEPFSVADSTQVLEVQMVSLPAAILSGQLTALIFESWSAGIEVSGAFKFGAAQPHFTVRNGNWLYAGAFWQTIAADDNVWRVALGYSQRQQNTSLITQTDKNIGLEVSYRWTLEQN